MRMGLDCGLRGVKGEVKVNKEHKKMIEKLLKNTNNK
jgi:hypothetical protein